MESTKVTDAIPECFKEKWGSCKQKLKTAFAILAADRKNGYPVTPHFRYYTEKGGFSWESETYEITMFPNGVCTMFDQSVQDRDSHSDTSYVGVYFLKEDKIVVKLLAYHSSGGWNYDEYLDSDKVVEKVFDVIGPKKIKEHDRELELC